MRKNRYWKNIIKMLMALSLTLWNTVHANGTSMNEPVWIFPGQEIPDDLGFRPLELGTDVQVQNRDWFLLKDQGMTVSPSVSSLYKGVYHGPILDDQNAQLYYRVVLGMILKETLVQMGMSPMQSRLYLDRVEQLGLELEEISLDEFGSLPDGLDRLYQDWDRPMLKLATLPYLILPLSIADNQSDFQHFYYGPIQGEASRSCSTIKDVVPLNSVYQELQTQQSLRSEVETQLSHLNALYHQSNSEVTSITTKLRQQSKLIDESMSCISSIKAKASQAQVKPTEKCLSLAEGIMAEAGLNDQWQRFLEVNLSNEKGDFKHMQEKEASLKTLEAKQKATKAIIDTLSAQVETLKRNITENEETLSRLQADRERQASLELTLEEKISTLNEEFQKLQELNHKLERGTLALDLSETEVQEAISGTAQRHQRIDTIKAELPKLLEEKSRLQENQASISTQIEYVQRQLDTFLIQLDAMRAQLGTTQEGLIAELNQLNDSIEEANQAYLEATDEYNFSEYILSILSRDLVTLSQKRDLEFEKLKEEESRAQSLRLQIEEATLRKDALMPSIENEMARIQKATEFYLSGNHMGWFLEQDCDLRSQFDSVETGIYLSRQPMTEVQWSAEGQLDGGKWGLFNMSYAHFQSSIQNGVLLNLPAYITLAVRNIISGYDYAAAQYLDPKGENCQELDASSSPSWAVVNLMRSAFSIWDEGNDNEAKAKGYCRIGTNSAENEKYRSRLNKLIAFKGSVIDQVLPKADQSRKQDRIERQAIEAITSEIAGLLGVATYDDSSSELRRDNTIKALLQVLAYDYEAAIAQTRESLTSKNKYQFASPAPKSSTSGKRKIEVNRVYGVQTLSASPLYTAPIDETEYLAAKSLRWGDSVKVLPVDESGAAERAGWSRVEVIGDKDNIYWLPSWVISYDQLINQSGREVYDLSDANNCPVLRLVESIDNFEAGDRVVTRLLPDLRSELRSSENLWTMSWFNNTRTTPGSPDKLYVACELFSQPDKNAAPASMDSQFKNYNEVDYSQVQGIRIVEVQEWKTASGETRYLPVEDFGGFVHTWLPTRNSVKPRILLGPKLDRETWSIQR